MDFPDIILESESSEHLALNDYYKNLIRRSIQKVTKDVSDIDSLLPLLTMGTATETPIKVSFSLLSEFHSTSFKFFFDMISSWLIPGERLSVSLFYGIDFRMPSISQKKYTFCEIVVSVESLSQLKFINKNYPLLGTELRLGASSPYFAKRILEVKGLSTDQKTALVQEHIAHLLKRLPDAIHQDIFSEMQHFFLTCSEEFKICRDSRHLCRLITVTYLFRRWLFEGLKIAPKKRHLYLKVFHAYSNGKKTLGIVIGLNYLESNELLEERHILKAIQTYVSSARPVEGSYIINRKGTETIGTVYLEVEKGSDDYFSTAEIQRLRRELPNDLKDRVEHLMHPVFMPRNEEEIMKNALTLAGQIHYLQDPSQVFITFDEQTPTKLFFTVILVRLLSDSSQEIEDYFNKKQSFLEFFPDWSKTIGMVRKHDKGASVFRVALSKEMFLRNDHSIDLCKARQIVFAELERLLGKLRDYNGGLISKQSEQLSQLRALLVDEGVVNDFILDNFFYATTPSQMRNFLDPESLKTLFLMMLEMVEEVSDQKEENVQIYRELDQIFVMVSSEYPDFKNTVLKELEDLNIPFMELASTFVHVNGIPCLGLIYRNSDPYSQEHFYQTVACSLVHCVQSSCN